MSDCIFCEIATGKRDSHIIQKEYGFVAFLDIDPYLPGHTIAIPNEHVQDLFSVYNQDKYLDFCKRIIYHFRNKSSTRLVYTFIMTHKVPHLGMHIIPNVSDSFRDSMDLLRLRGGYNGTESLNQVYDYYKMMK